MGFCHIIEIAVEHEIMVKWIYKYGDHLSTITLYQKLHSDYWLFGYNGSAHCLL